MYLKKKEGLNDNSVITLLSSKNSTRALVAVNSIEIYFLCLLFMG